MILCRFLYSNGVYRGLELNPDPILPTPTPTPPPWHKHSKTRETLVECLQWYKNLLTRINMRSQLWWYVYALFYNLL